MNIQDLSLEQLKEIVDGAPEGATFYDSKNRKYVKTNYDGAYFFTEHGNWSRISITASDFLIVNFPRLSDIRTRITELEAQKDINVTLSAESIENKGVDGSEKITVKLNPAKCRVVDPTVYDAPSDSPRDDFDAMSESHRSPGCKCHEFQFDAELEVPVVASQQQIGGDHYTKLAIQPMHYSMANKLNPAQHTIIKYVTRYPDKGGIQDLLKARHTIDLLIERLEGEQGE